MRLQALSYDPAMRTGARTLFLASLLASSSWGCEKSGKASETPEGQKAALATKAEGEQLEQIRAALRYRRGAEQRGKLIWQDGENGRAATMVGMYLQGSEDLGELSLSKSRGKAVSGSISILARGGGVGSKCKVELRAGSDPIDVRTSFERNATPPEGLDVEVDRMNFDLDLKTLGRLASNADSGGTACGLAFTFTQAQRDRIDRVAKLFGGDVDDAAMSEAQAAWDTDRLPAPDGGFRELGAELSPSE